MKSKKERRKFERFPMEVPVRVTRTREDGEPVTTEFQTENISAGGVLIRTDEPLDPGTPVNICLTLPLDHLRKLDDHHAEVSLSGTVIRTADTGAVIEFDTSFAVSSSGADKGVDQESALAQLTRRERQMLKMISTGASNKDIAKDLSIGLSTVKSHVYSLFKKIKVKNRFQAILWYSHNSA